MARKSNRARRVRGSGSVFSTVRRGVTVWVARLPVGRTPTGRTVYREVSAPTAAEALAKLAQLKPPTPTTTVAEWCAQWIAGLTVRASTADTYRATITHYVNPVLGHLRLADLTPYQIETAARVWGEQRSPNTVRLALAHLRVCLGAAVRAGAIPANPCTIARKPKGKPKTIEPFTAAELSRIIIAAGESPGTRIVAVLAGCGLRVGEAVALDVTDYDPAHHTLSVTRSHHYRHGTGPTKSTYGERVVSVPEPARTAVVAAIGRRKRGPLFATAGGGRPHRSGILRPWVRLLRQLELPYRNLHQLRHSVATLLSSRGVPPADAAAYLGHTVAVYLRIYCHPTGADVGAVLASILDPKSVRKVGADGDETRLFPGIAGESEDRQ